MGVSLVLSRHFRDLCSWFCRFHFNMCTFTPLLQRNLHSSTWMLHVINGKNMHAYATKVLTTTVATTDPNVTFVKLSQDFRLVAYFRGPLRT